MRIVDLSVDSTKLYKTYVELVQAWDRTKEHWKDENSQNFEDNHLAEISPLVKLLMDASNRMNDVFAQAYRDLQNPGEG